MKTLSLSTWNYRYSDAKNSLWTIPFAHSLAVIIFIGAGIFTARLGLNIFIPMFFAVAFYMLDLRSVKSVNVIVFLYFLLCTFELVFIGIPEIPIRGAHDISKGILFEMVVNILPWLYMTIKFSLGIILIRFLSILKSNPEK